MATRVDLKNESSSEVEFSGKIGNTNRSRKSSRFLKYSRRKRLSDKSCSDSDDGRACTPLPRRHQKKEYEKGGYSSSEEQSEHDLNRVTYEGTSDDELDNRAHSSVVRKRRNHAREASPEVITTETKVSVEHHRDLLDDSPKGWELIEECLKVDDSPLTASNGESSDDFWKCDAQTKSSTTEQKIEKKKETIIETNNVSRSKRFFRQVPVLFSMLKNSRSEWKLFKTDNQRDWKILKQRFYECSIGLLIIFIFCGIGGIVFRSTEGAFEMFYKCGVKRVKRDFLDSLYSKRWLNEDEWKSLARTKLMEFENQLYDAYDAGMTSYSGQKGWSFINAFIYCITVVTTIGYGHLAPITTAGRIITIIYAIFGIPLFLLLLADYGKLLTRGIKFVWAYVRRLYYTGSCRKVRKTAPVQEVVKGMQLVIDNVNKVRKSSNAKLDEPVVPRPVTPVDTPAFSAYTVDDNFNIPISVAFAILILYIIGGAFLFSFLQNWNFFEAFYFVFISTSTIGLGDYVPEGKVEILLCSLVYFVFGLALTTMCINVVTEKLTDSFRAATAKIGATMGLELAGEEDADIDLKEEEN